MNRSFEKAVSFVEQASKTLMGGFAVSKLVVEKKIGSFESKTSF